MSSSSPRSFRSDRFIPDPAVGTVSAGLVTAVAPGTVTITATSEGVSGTAGVTVIHLAFSALSAGDHRTCGVTAAGRAACWGGNDYGGLGDGSTAQHSTPVLVAGGVAFAAVSAAGGETFDPGDHACGVSAGGAAYCWGFNSFGQLGDGTTTGPEQCLASVPCSTGPLAVLGGLTFTMVSANHLRSCGVTTGAAAWPCPRVSGGPASTVGVSGRRVLPSVCPARTCLL